MKNPHLEGLLNNTIIENSPEFAEFIKSQLKEIEK